MRIRTISCLIALVGLSACASMPNGNFNYYLPKTEAELSVARTITCVGENALVSDVATLNHRNVVDLAAAHSVPLSYFDGAIADAKVTFELHPNGTLKGIGTKSTGKGEAVISSILKLASNLIGSPGGRAGFCDPANPLLTENSVTIEYAGPISLSRTNKMQHVPLSPKWAEAGKIIDASFGKLYAHVLHGSASRPLVDGVDATRPHLLLRQPGRAIVTVYKGHDLKVADVAKLKSLWSHDLIATQAGTTYLLPIQKPGAFGATEFELLLREDGSLAKLVYGKTDGTGDAVTSADELLETVDRQTDQEEITSIKNEIDLIKQRRRLAACRADPETCE